MSASKKTDRCSTSVAWIIAPLIIAMSAGIGSGLTLDNTIRTERTNDTRIDEAELGLAHGRIASSLFMLQTFEVVQGYDADHTRQANAVAGFAAEVFSEETARLEALQSRSPERTEVATELLEALERATAPGLDPGERQVARVEFEASTPELATTHGRASLELSTAANLAPANLALELIVADALIHERVADLPTVRHEIIHTLEDGLGGSLPFTDSGAVFDPDLNVDTEFPSAFAALGQEFEKTDDLHPSAHWLAEFAPFFADGASAIDEAPGTMSDDLDAAVSLFIRVDRTMASELQRAINADRVDAAQASNRGWAIGVFSGIVAIAMLTLTTAAMIRRRREFGLLQAAASVDALTGLANRRAFNTRANQHLDEGNSSHVLFHIDIDEFKAINDGLGHAAGDDVLCELSRRLESITQRWCESPLVEDAHAARLGGDEFTVALHGIDLTVTDLGELAEELRTHASGTIDTVAGPAELRLSIGCSSSLPDESLEQLAQRADLALYDAKRTGRDRSSVFADPDQVHWNMPSVAARILADQQPTVSASSEFVRELVDLTQRFGVELTTSTRPGAHSSRGTDGIRVNLILVESSDEPRPNRRFTDFPANAGGPSSTAGPTPSEQH